MIKQKQQKQINHENCSKTNLATHELKNNRQL